MIWTGLIVSKIMEQPELFIILYPPFSVITGQLRPVFKNIIYTKTKIPAWQKDAVVYCLNKISFKGHRNRVDNYQNMLAESYLPINWDRYELKIAYCFVVINVGNDPRNFELPNPERAFTNGAIHWRQSSIAV
ncbi:hypothetical protein SRABI27_02165 [Pedobacter sp. Bi27]|nr:hypothetical protein SRABI27_02165 [Pedobacter sp. Bi27]CAH0231702.1 hypothetical protein SRABI36_02737 [Pedobacter sp. Bi36]CAH0258494.1 hypothetical protein SRABI126_03137 [Pedobacter sp. Bi126]